MLIKTPLPVLPEMMLRSPAVTPPSNTEISHGWEHLQLTAQEMLPLEQVARRHGLTLSTVLHGAWALLLHRHTRCRDVMFGSIASGRQCPMPGIESVGGLVAVTQPLRTRVPPEATVAAWLRLHDAHAIVLYEGTTHLRMANPFSADQTPYRVWADEKWWFANCAWDAFGICAALHSDGRIETSCAECSEPIVCEVRDAQVSDENLLFHCLVPAAHWWDDIVFT